MTNRISRDGAVVGYMFREVDRAAPEDTGWRFLAGDEDDAYLDDAQNSHVFAVNTIANHDSAIVPYLEAPPGSGWFRSEDRFVPDPQGAPEPR